MSYVTDPDNLDRYQVAIDPIAETVSLRGMGTARTSAAGSDGSSDGTTTFTSAGSTFTTDVTADDVLAIISDPADDGLIIGHYRVVSITDGTHIVVDRAIPTSTAANLTFKVTAPQTPGASTEQLADGVNMQCLTSFWKEEWITLAAGLGNAVDLNRFTIPHQTISSAAGQYILGGVNGDASSAWSFNDTNGVQTTDTEGVTRELIRDGGWQERDSSDVVLREYANYTTLGTLDSDAQATLQQGDATGDPVSFKLTGPVNQAYLTFGPDVGPDAVSTGFEFAATTITRNDGGNWADDNYRVGDYVTIRSAEDGGNDGSYGPITAVDDSVDGAITIASGAFTVNADDTTAIFQVDHRLYSALRCRKKGRYYALALHADGGVPASGILPLINKFPLSHAQDPAIVTAATDLAIYDDGTVSGGDGTTTIFQENESHTTGSDGAIGSAVAADGTFTFTSAGSTFNSTARTSVQVLQPGDSIEIDSGSYQGVYEIKSIDDANTLTCYAEPGRSYPGVEGTLDFTVRTGVLDVGHASNGTLADVDGDTGTLSSAGSTFDVDTAIGDRQVNAGDIVQLISGTGGHEGYYTVVSRDSATQLTLNTSDHVFDAQSDWEYRVWRPGMFLQRFASSATIAGASTIAFGDDDPDTLTRTGGSWITDGFLDGMALTVVDAEDQGNIQTVIIDTVDSATVITLIVEEAVTANADDTTASTNGNVTGDSGITRTINSVVYPFHWRLFTNGGSLAEIWAFIQHQLRREYDIDGGAGSERGDVTDDLMAYVSPNGTMLDCFPDDLAVSDLNNVTYQDVSGDNRNNAFLVGLTFVPNANLIASATARLTMYFTTNPSGNFGSNDAVIIDDNTATDMDFTSITGNIQRSFDYTNNAQGGRTPDEDAAYTLVALGDDQAVHILQTGTITKVNSITIPVSPALERNYSNP